jgi:hypothetical protein
MGWLDANEYLLMEMAGRDRIDDMTRTDPLVTATGDSHDGADVPHEMCKRAPRFMGRPRFAGRPRFVGRLMYFLLSPGWRVAPDHVSAGHRR